MRLRSGRSPDAHDLVFGAFLLLMAGRLVAVEGASGPHAILYLGFVALHAAVLLAAPIWLRLAFYPFALQAAYFTLGPAMRALQVPSADGLLQQIDLRVLGGNLSVALEPIAHPLLTDLMSACYLLFFPYLILTHLDYFRGDIDTLRRFCIGLYTVYAGGLIGYALVPAAGPYVAMAGDFLRPLDGGWLTRIHHSIVVQGTNGVDVFPSLHCGVTSFLLFFDRRHSPRRYRVLLVPVAILWVSTIYLRYHYFVDVVAGFALSAVGLALARERRRERILLTARAR
jgi:PAP2 superfamily